MMPAYRFCRTDDIAFLTHAVNACYVVHFPDEREISTDDFKREIRELNLWCSSCMVASANGDPIGVVTGAKREHETLIHRIGVHPDFQRQGHARHVLESLAQKLSVLGPPRVVAELPEDEAAVRALFEAVGYEAEESFADFVLTSPLAPVRATDTLGPAKDTLGPASLDDLLRYEAFDTRIARSWERALPTLQNRKDELRGFAIASGTRVEAYTLFRDLPGRREIAALGAATPALLEVALRVACQAGSLEVIVPRVSDEEISWPRLRSLGFQKTRAYTRYARSVA